jgi:hypothetical protein
VAHRLQRRGERRRGRAGFQLHRAGAGDAGAGQGERLVGRQVPVQQRDERLRDMPDDARPTRRPRQDLRPPGAIEDDGRRGGGARALARLDPVRDGAAILLGEEGEVGELVVQQEATEKDARAPSPPRSWG